MISTDNTTVVSYINKHGGTHSPNLCVEVWKNPPVVSKTAYCRQDSTNPRQIQCFGRQVIENRKNNQRMGIGSIDSEFNFPTVQLSQYGSVCHTFQSQTSTLSIPSSGQSSLSDRRILYELEQSSCLCISSNNTDFSCLEQDTSVSVQNSSYSPSLAATSMVLRGTTTACISSSSSSIFFSKLLTQTKGKFQQQILPTLNLHAWELSSNQLEIKIFAKRCRFCLQVKTNINRKSMTRNGPYIPVGVIESRLIRSLPLLLL